MFCGMGRSERAAGAGDPPHTTGSTAHRDTATTPQATGRPVNERQLEVLTWIANGCPEREWGDTTYKTVAVALQNRRLAIVTRRRGTWRAEVTAAGRYYVEHGMYPDSHWTGAPDAAARQTSPGTRSATVQQPLVVAAPQPPAAPVDGRTGRADVSSDTTSSAAPASSIRVPARLSNRPHVAVQAIQRTPDALAMLSKPLRARALRVLEAVAKEAERRGYQVAERDGALRIGIRGHVETINLREPTTRTRHVPTDAEVAAQSRDPWRRPPKWDTHPSGRLRVVVGHRDVVEPKPRKNDTVAWVLEDRLDRVLGLVEEAVAAKEERERRRRDEAEAKQSRWEQVQAQAVLDFQENQRVELLHDQVERWQECMRLETFLEALDEHIGTLTNTEDAATASEWRRWVAGYASRRSPFAEPIHAPPDVAPSAHELAPFMRGLSPYGPGY